MIPSAYRREGDISALGAQKEFTDQEMPGFGMSLLTATLPVILMLISTITQLVTGNAKPTNLFESIIYMVGTAGTAMLIAVLFAIVTMGLMRKRKMNHIMESVTNAIYPIGMMLLIIGGGGTFKQVLIDGGVGNTIAKMFEGTEMSPILLKMDCCSCATYRIRFGYSSCDFNYRYCLTIITIIRCKCCISCTCDRCR